jgi:hypothetical protein
MIDVSGERWSVRAARYVAAQPRGQDGRWLICTSDWHTNISSLFASIGYWLCQAEEFLLGDGRDVNEIQEYHK